MRTEIEKITKLLHRSFEKGAWHGPTVKESIQDVTQETSWKRLPGTHSIIELVGHMASWRNYVAKKLNGDIEYAVSDEMNFPAAQDWSKAVADLEESQRNLLSAVEKFPDEKLADLTQGVTSKYTHYTMLHGIIHHDLYHTGQIILIKKAAATQSS
jgi:uncharacterized damage-inducible protein DinB